MTRRIAILGVCLAGVCAVHAGGVDEEPENESRAVRLPPMTVVAEDLPPAWVYGQRDGIGRLLAAVPDVLVLSQGGVGVQNDLVIRGSSFSGAGLALGGLSLRNPQTEHFHAELPLPSALLTAPAVVTGLEQARETDGHLAGAVALDFAPVRARRRVGAGGGEIDRQWAQAIVQQPFGAGFGASAFGGYESAESIDYPDNDLEVAGGGAHAQWTADGARADVVAARRNKRFGARGYYGVSDTLSAEEEIEDTLVLGSGRWDDGDGRTLRVTAAWRELVDDYAILPDIFVNHTRSRVLSAMADGSVPLGDELALDWRLGGEDQKLDGLTLGGQRLKRGVGMLLPRWRREALALSAGLRAEVFGGDDPALLPQAGGEVGVADGLSVFAAYTETVRQPSFTELNYESPASLGNMGLDRQEARTLEGGVKGQAGDAVDWRAAVFHRRSENTVDWVRLTPESVRFEATDLGEVDTLGVELSVDAALREELDLTAAYAWLDKDEALEVYAGRYALDYARHRVTLAGVWRVCEGLEVVGTQTLRWQRENPLRRSDDFGADGALAVHAAVPAVEALVVTLAVENLWDDDFEVYAGQRVAGRRFSGGVTLDW